MLTVFLDLDGVLTTYSWVKQFKKMSDKCPLDPRCVYWFNHLCDEFDFNIVMNTAWIIDGDDFDIVRRQFELEGIKKNPIDFVSPVVKLSETRKTGALSQYIETHNIDKNKVLVIDDLSFKFHNILPRKSIYIVEDGWNKNGIDLYHYKNIKQRLKELYNYTL